VASDLAVQLRASRATDDAELESIASAFREWATADDGWWIVPHGEVLARP